MQSTLRRDVCDRARNFPLVARWLPASLPVPLMQILRASEAVSPAFARTRLLLFSPFRFGRTWKLCATAYACAKKAARPGYMR